MNRVKYRPVGKSGPIVEVKVTQSKRALTGTMGINGVVFGGRGVSVKNANRNMDANGYVRAGVRHG